MRGNFYVVDEEGNLKLAVEPPDDEIGKALEEGAAVVWLPPTSGYWQQGVSYSQEPEKPWLWRVDKGDWRIAGVKRGCVLALLPGCRIGVSTYGSGRPISLSLACNVKGRIEPCPAPAPRQYEYSTRM